MNGSDQVYNKEFWETLGVRRNSLERKIEEEESKQIKYKNQIASGIRVNQISSYLTASEIKIIKLKKALEILDHLIVRKVQLLEDAKSEEKNLGRF